MKRHLPFFIAIALTCPLLAAAPAAAQEKGGDLGVGFIAGAPLGFSAKYWFDQRLAVDTALGVEGGDFAAQADLLTHLHGLLPKPAKGSLPLYLGLGWKYIDERRDFLGIRFLAGASYIVENQPLELFAEISPILRVEPDTAGEIGGGVGLRYYFSLGR